MAVLAIAVNGLSAWLLHDVVGHNHSHGHAHGPAHGHEHTHASHHEHDAEGHDHTGHDHAHPDHAHDGQDPACADPPAAPRKARGHALNLRGAWLHLAGDALGAVAALVAALVIRFGGPATADPIASFAVAAILVVGALALLKDASLVLLEAHLPVALVRQIIVGFPGVTSVHALHVWTLGAGHDALTVHVGTRATDPTFGQRLSDRLRTQLGTEYVTVQVEVVRDAMAAAAGAAGMNDASAKDSRATN
jgi:cation diffusion facilitator family transporter